MRLIAVLALAGSIVLSACSAAGTATPQPASSADALTTPEEAALLAGARMDLQGTCGPLRVGLPDGAIAAIACRPSSDVVGQAAVYLFDTEAALMASYLARLTELGIQPRTNGGRCLPGRASEGAYVPGDEGPDLSSTRGACYLDDAGDADYVAMLPPFALIQVDGIVPDTEAVERFGWLGNQDQPGSPTIWSPTGPLSPEK